MNIVLGIPNDDKIKDNFINIISSAFDELLQKSKTQNNLTVGFSPEDVGQLLEELPTDLLILTEKYGEKENERIGIGLINQWQTKYPDTFIALVVNQDSVSKTKLNTLYKGNYYNLIYSKDFVNGDILDLYLKGRTKEEAAAYYNLKPKEEANQTKGNLLNIRGVNDKPEAEATVEPKIPFTVIKGHVTEVFEDGSFRVKTNPELEPINVSEYKENILGLPATLFVPLN